MRTFDLSPTTEHYYRQNGWGPGRNEIDAPNVCKPTGSIMGHAVAGWPVPSHVAATVAAAAMSGIKFDPKLCTFKQPEDNLTALCRTPEAYAYMRANYPWLDPNTKPNEVWGVIAWGLKILYGIVTIEGPRFNWDLREALWGISRWRRPFVASTWLAPAGHVVNLNGYKTEQNDIAPTWMDLDLAAVKEVIVDDPAGHHLPGGGYDSSKTGYHERYTLEEWKRYWRGVGIQILRKE
ncbi:MAG: hypothetical protein PHS14_08180 [Elusimicrobia bacterium]|nr:hypothetical protein [Elusimicrobiota bacterium]